MLYSIKENNGVPAMGLYIYLLSEALFILVLFISILNLRIMRKFKIIAVSLFLLLSIISCNQYSKTILGSYNGTSLNKTAMKTGSVFLNIVSMNERTGEIRADIKWYNGLYGEGTLYGQVKNNNINLKGTVSSITTSSWETEISGEFTDSSVHCTYRLFPNVGNSNGTQDGEFNISKISNLSYSNQ